VNIGGELGGIAPKAEPGATEKAKDNKPAFEEDEKKVLGRNVLTEDPDHDAIVF
jgi:hypothetical protein